MEIVLILWTNIDAVVVAILAVIGVASLVTAGTETPDPTTRLGKLYHWIEMAALVVGKAKDTGPK